MTEGLDAKRARLAELEAEATRLRAELQHTDGYAPPAPLALLEPLEPLEPMQPLLQVSSLAERVAHLGSWSWDLHRDLVVWSDELCRILGLDPLTARASPTGFFDAVHAEDRGFVEQTAQQAVLNGEVIPLEFRVVRPTGEERFVRLEGAMLRDETGRQTHMVGTVLDITEQRQSALLLARTVGELNEAQRIAGLASWRWDTTWLHMHWSAGMYRLLGVPETLTPDQALFAEHIHFEDQEALMSLREQLLHGDDIDPYEFRIVQSSGTVRWVVQHTLSKRDHNGVLLGIAGVLQDITERKALEDQLRHSQKMEAVGTLAGGVAHDFNNYLMVIAGYTELLQEQLAAGDPARESVQAIADAYQRCAHLTQQLLTLSRKRSAQPVHVELTALVAQLAPLMQSVLGELIELGLSLEPEALWTVADPLQVEQALMNLVVNARDAMANGGELVVRVEPHEDRNTRERFVRLSVSDVGCGIPLELRSRIFEPFFTTKQVGQGTGLGLSTVYAIVRDAGARIELESEPGLGSTFHIDWTRCEAPSGVPRKSLPPAPGEQLRARTILVVEDVARVRDLLAEQLERGGYQVQCAPHGVAALERLAHESFDLVLSDMVMPQLGGVELARAIRARYPHTRCVLMTGYSPEALNGQVPEGSELSEVVLRKPFSTADLLRAVRRALTLRRESLPSVSSDRS